MISTLIALTSLAPAVSGKVLLASGKPAGQAVVWLEGGSKSKPIKAVVDQRNRAFDPHISVVPVGSTIEFPNNDTVFHNVFAAFNAKKFDLGLYSKGQKKSQTFDKPGLVALMCSIHSEMSAFIMVVDSAYYAVASKAGIFRLNDVPVGEYELKVWHETGETVSQTIKVGGNESVEVRTKRR
ncbi:MAG TPA: hypothetical protein PKA27_11850 [Fimbriimonadaceae bacterium]|nr:hypothetical protein [Fimbriimonadaceae bacterium]